MPDEYFFSIFRPRSQYFFGNHVEEEHHHSGLPSRPQQQHRSLHDLSGLHVPQVEPVQNPNNSQQSSHGPSSRVKQSPIVQRIRTRNAGSESSDIPESILSNRSNSSRTFSSRDSPALKNVEETTDMARVGPTPSKTKKADQSPIVLRKSSLKSTQSKDSPPSIPKNGHSKEDLNSEESDTDRRLNRGLQKSNQILRERYVSKNE